MADGAVGFVVQKLGTLVTDEEKLLRGLRAEVVEIKAELESISCFLKHVDDARAEIQPGIKGWVKQVREVAYDIEDVLDQYTFRLSETHRQGLISCIRRCSHRIKRLKARHGVAMEIQDLKTRVRNIADRKERYDLNSQEQDGIITSVTASTHKLHYHSREDALLLKDANVVGISERRDELIAWLVRGDDSRLGVVSVFGTGGVGKTTLVRKVYDSQDVKEHFECHAWVTMSQWSHTEDILRELIRQLSPTGYEANLQQIVSIDNVKLSEVLIKCLEGKRYVFVFDDIWDIHAWRGIKNAFPDSNCGNRIVVTTRSSDIAQSCVENPGYAVNLQPLSWDFAWTLFCKEAFKSNTGNSCPSELKDIAKKILQNCDGLPLAIVLIADFLSIKQQTLTVWDEVHRSLGYLVETNSLLSGINYIFMLSYNDLPHYLKSCFLYLGIFPKSYYVSCRRLSRLWIAEGFVNVEKGHDRRTLEEVAEGYLDELIKRSLIQVEETDSGGKLKTCRVHDLMHDFILREAREQNLYTVLDDDEQVDRNTLPEKIRRLSILNSSTEEGIPNQNSTSSSSSSFFHIQSLRSFFLFRVDKFSNSSISTLLSSSRLLKVLDLEDAPVEDFPSELSNLFRLSYLSLKNTKINSLPSSVGKLTRLETLNLKGTLVKELPADILKLQRLRILLCYRIHKETFGGKLGVKLPAGTGSLIALEKLSCFDADTGREIIEELKRLTRLRRLGITNLRKEDGLRLCASVEKMKQLRSFDVASAKTEELLDIQTLRSPPEFLQHLYLKGRMDKIPSWISSLKTLEKLHLVGSGLRSDPIKPLQVLPILAELKLQQAYEEETLYFVAGAFPRLRHLELIGLSKLISVVVEEKAMPSIRILHFVDCEKLEKVPLGIEHLTSLREIHIGKMPQEFKNRIKSRDCWKPGHYPFIVDLDSDIGAAIAVILAGIFLLPLILPLMICTIM